MTMDDTEIAINYKQAKNKREQVKILAELNTCTRETIIEALKRGGIAMQELENEGIKIRKRGRPKAAEVKEPETAVPATVELADKTVEIPEPAGKNFRNALQGFMDDVLDNQIKVIEGQIKSLTRTKQRLERLYAGMAGYLKEDN